MDDILSAVGLIVYVTGSLIITFPGIEFFEKCHRPGRLLRGLEKLEADSIEADDCGFREIKETVRSCSNQCESIPKDVHKIDTWAGTVTTGKGALLKIRLHGECDETCVIEDPIFAKLRYQIDRKIRREKTKIRSVGILIVLVGFFIRIWY
jgi:hypothetical protein